LPDSDLMGPCASELLAINDARESAGYYPGEHREWCPECFAEAYIVAKSSDFLLGYSVHGWVVVDCPDCGIQRID